MTFFALLGLVVVEAVQNSPCWLKVGRKGVFRACRESFVPGGPYEAACWESFVPVGPSGAVCWESFVPGGPYGAACWESFVPAPASRAVQSSPCVACYWREREKILPACGKWAEIGALGRAGRVLYRYRPPGVRAGRVLYRVGPPGVRAGRALSRHRPRMRYKGLPAWSVCSPSVTKFAQHPESGPKCAFCGVPGEFCTGWACLGRPAPPQPTSRAPAPRELGRSATAWCRRRTPTPRPRPTRSG